MVDWDVTCNIGGAIHNMVKLKTTMKPLKRQNLRNLPKQVHYGENNDSDDECVLDNVIIEEENESLNKKKHYNNIVNYDTREDWQIDVDRLIPKGSEIKDSHFLYITFHPGIYKLFVANILVHMSDIFNFPQCEVKKDKYGKAIIKDILYFSFPADGKDRTLMITLYPTKSAIYVKVKGNNKETFEKFRDKGF